MACSENSQAQSEHQKLLIIFPWLISLSCFCLFDKIKVLSKLLYLFCVDLFCLCYSLVFTVWLGRFGNSLFWFWTLEWCKLSRGTLWLDLFRGLSLVLVQGCNLLLVHECRLVFEILLSVSLSSLFWGLISEVRVNFRIFFYCLLAEWAFLGFGDLDSAVLAYSLVVAWLQDVSDIHIFGGADGALTINLDVITLGEFLFILCELLFSAHVQLFKLFLDLHWFLYCF